MIAKRLAASLHYQVKFKSPPVAICELAYNGSALMSCSRASADTLLRKFKDVLRLRLV